MIKPIGDKILIKFVQVADRTESGLFIPEQAKAKPTQAEVIAIGTEKLNGQGMPLPFYVKKGDVVIVGRYAGTEVKVDGESYSVISEDDILAKVVPETTISKGPKGKSVVKEGNLIVGEQG